MGMNQKQIKILKTEKRKKIGKNNYGNLNNK